MARERPPMSGPTSSAGKRAPASGPSSAGGKTSDPRPLTARARNERGQSNTAAFDEHGVPPDAVEFGDALADADRSETGASVQRDARLVLREDRGLECP